MIIGISSLKPAILQYFFSLGCLQAVTPCLGLIITALMKKQTKQPIIRFICPLGFTNIAVSQAAVLSFWLQCFMVSLTEWSHTVICVEVWGEQHAVSLETAKLCRRQECMSQKWQRGEERLIGDLQLDFHWRKACLITWPAKPFIWPAAVSISHPSNLPLKIPACFLTGRTSCQWALVSQGAETHRDPCRYSTHAVGCHPKAAQATHRQSPIQPSTSVSPFRGVIFPTLYMIKDTVLTAKGFPGVALC